MIAPAVLDVICCPRCQGELKYAAKEHVLVCAACRLCFKSTENKVDLRLDYASVIKAGGKIMPVSEESVTLKPVKGPALSAVRGAGLPLSKGSAVVIARQTEDADESGKEGLLHLEEHLADSTQKILANFMVGPTKQRTTDIASCFGFRRLPDCYVPDPAISKVHCLFFYDERGKLGVFDLLSRNGTYVNGKEIESCALAPGDVVQFGNSVLKIVFPE